MQQGKAGRETTPGVFALGPYRSFDTFKGQSGVLVFSETS